MIYTIRNADLSDKQAIVTFIDVHWKKQHALVKSDELFFFQHLEKDGSLNFIIAINNDTKEVDGLFGYIPVSHFDSNMYECGLFWGAIWKIRTDINNKEIRKIGLKMLGAIIALPQFKVYAAIGISLVAKNIYTVLKYKIDYLRHYYIVNSQFNTFNVSKNIKIKTDTNVSEGKQEGAYKLESISINDYKDYSIQTSYFPFKSMAYLINRYERHPIYRYLFYGLFKADILTTIFVVRKIEVENSIVLRIIDICGNVNELPGLYNHFQTILREHNAEYIDLLNYGMDSLYLKKIGFELLDFDSEIIIPSYFEPFLKENVKIEFAYSGNEDYVIFKGDSDQDRPNIL